MVMMATSADATRSLGESVEDENKRRGQRRERGRDETGIASTATVVAGVIDRRRRRRRRLRRRRHSAHHSPPRFPIDSVSVSGLDGWDGNALLPPILGPKSTLNQRLLRPLFHGGRTISAGTKMS